MDGPGWRVGSRFGPYELRSLLGKGGMGEVYEAYDTVKDRVVAVKLLSEELAKDPVYQVRFRRESQAAARLAEPHVIPIHDWGVIDGVLFIDMRLVNGVDLRTVLRGQGPISPQRAVFLVEQIAAALDAAHESGLVHRDVKPANILVTDADFAYLVDFGIAHTEGDSAVTQVGMAVGSYIYMAPERFDVGPVTGRADIYSLACVLHECLTGATPFPAASMSVLIKSHLSDPPPQPSVERPGIPPALDEVIARGMAKDPADRFATASELARAARAVVGSPSPAATGPMFVVRAPDPARFGQSDRTARGATVPPESTGELSVPAIIHPTAPTEIRPADIQFTPLPPQQPQAPPATGPLPQMRPFPDAHLYPESQRYAEPQYAENHETGYNEPRYADPYPAPQEPAQFTAPETRRYAVPPVPEAPQPAPETQRYVVSPVPEVPQPAPETQRYPEAPFAPPHQPRHGAQPVPQPTYADYVAQGPVGEPYPPGGYGADAYGERYDHADPYSSPYSAEGPRRSIVLPLLFAVLVIVVVTVSGAVVWQTMSSRGGVVDTAAEGSTGTSLTSARPPGASATSAARTTAPASTSTAPARLPDGATPCGAGQGSGAFSRAAVGNAVTSCPFAEEVRKAYAAAGSAGGSRSVVAVSPVTGRSYTMTCAAQGQVVVCTGGENAVVYVY
ncbi:protein kinase domain-containing protein [Nocardia sp. bgisy118]|uniref:serine/threonine-protein kinase n=1 Tax=Nocardia sp. bgisy118 TaxID=3413786 RepID=UPI003F4A2F98